MSGVAIVIQLDDTAAADVLGKLRAASINLAPMLDDIGAELETSTLERFRTNIGPDGVAWPQSLRARERGTPTLVDTTALRDSVHYRVDSDVAVEIGAGGVAKDYAAIHQLGGTITAKGKALRFTLATGQTVAVKSVRIPARPYLGLSAEDQVAIPEIAADHWRRAMAGA